MFQIMFQIRKFLVDPRQIPLVAKREQIRVALLVALPVIVKSAVDSISAGMLPIPLLHLVSKSLGIWDEVLAPGLLPGYTTVLRFTYIGDQRTWETRGKVKRHGK